MCVCFTGCVWCFFFFLLLYCVPFIVTPLLHLVHLVWFLLCPTWLTFFWIILPYQIPEFVEFTPRPSPFARKYIQLVWDTLGQFVQLMLHGTDLTQNSVQADIILLVHAALECTTYTRSTRHLVQGVSYL